MGDGEEVAAGVELDELDVGEGGADGGDDVLAVVPVGGVLEDGAGDGVEDACPASEGFGIESDEGRAGLEGCGDTLERGALAGHGAEAEGAEGGVQRGSREVEAGGVCLKEVDVGPAMDPDGGAGGFQHAGAIVDGQDAACAADKGVEVGVVDAGAAGEVEDGGAGSEAGGGDGELLEAALAAEADAEADGAVEARVASEEVVGAFAVGEFEGLGIWRGWGLRP